ECETLVIGIIGWMTTIAHDRSHLVFRRFELFRRVYLRKHNERTPAAVSLLVSRIRNVDHVVAREPEDRTQRFEHAENEIRPPIDAYLLSDSPVSGRIIKQVLQHVGTNDADVASGCTFTLGPDAADIDRHAIDIKHRDRLYATNANVFGFLIGILDGLDRIRRKTDAPARRTQSLNRLRVFVRHVFTAIEFDEIFARLDDLRILGNSENSR